MGEASKLCIRALVAKLGSFTHYHPNGRPRRVDGKPRRVDGKPRRADGKASRPDGKPRQKCPRPWDKFFASDFLDFSVRLVPNLGATLGVGLGVGNTKENHLDNQRVKCWVCWVSPTVCQHVGARVYVFARTYRQIAVRAGTGPTPTSDYKSQYSEYQAVATLGFDQPLP